MTIKNFKTRKWKPGEKLYTISSNYVYGELIPNRVVPIIVRSIAKIQKVLDTYEVNSVEFQPEIELMKYERIPIWTYPYETPLRRLIHVSYASEVHCSMNSARRALLKALQKEKEIRKTEIAQREVMLKEIDTRYEYYMNQSDTF